MTLEVVNTVFSIPIILIVLGVILLVLDTLMFDISLLPIELSLISAGVFAFIINDQSILRNIIYLIAFAIIWYLIFYIKSRTSNKITPEVLNSLRGQRAWALQFFKVDGKEIYEGRVRFSFGYNGKDIFEAYSEKKIKYSARIRPVGIKDGKLLVEEAEEEKERYKNLNRKSSSEKENK